MGMFDYLDCQMPLPADPPPPKRGQFQTKDTGAQALEQYTITNEGRLIHHVVENQVVPQAERSFPNAEPGSWQELAGSIRRVPREKVDTCFYGELRFYTVEEWEWWEYLAIFKDGQCTDIRCIEHYFIKSKGE